MQKQIKITLFILGLSLVSALNTSVVATPTCQPQKVESITLTPMGNNMHLLSWDAMLGTGPYSLTVFNLTTQTLHSTCNTASTSSVVMGLVVGNTYRFSVQRGSTIIIVDNIVN